MFTLIGNISILVAVITDLHLHTPMYFFLGNLSFFDIFYSSTTVPKMMTGLIIATTTISFVNCIVQLYFFHFLGCTEALLLSSMSYDRYVAICNPLRYNVIMSHSACFQLICICWILSFVYSLTHTVLTSKLPFCKLNHISHFFCDIKPLLKLACADTTLNESLVTIITGFVALSTCFLILLSYVLIGTHLLKIRTSQERRKAFSTCTSHLIVVLLYYGPGFFTYLRPAKKYSMEQDRQTAVLNTLITPVLNPLIYALRNQEVKLSIQRVFLGYKDLTN
ncbi:olfactory receptor 12D3-like [Rhinophrynus dorsalis]